MKNIIFLSSADKKPFGGNKIIYQFSNYINSQRQFSSQVVHIKKRLHTAGHVGLLEPITRCNEGQRVAEKDNFVRFKPMDSRFPFMMLPKSQAPKEFIQDPNECESRLYKCEVESAKWNEKSRFPLCTYITQTGTTRY